MRHDFWVPDMAEVDWDGVLGTYRPLLHADRQPPTTSPTCSGRWSASWAPRTRTCGPRPSRRAHGDRPARLLGADLAPGRGRQLAGGRGSLPGESSDPRARSPLAAPGAAVPAGDSAAGGGRAAG